MFSHVCVSDNARKRHNVVVMEIDPVELWWVLDTVRVWGFPHPRVSCTKRLTTLFPTRTTHIRLPKSVLRLDKSQDVYERTYKNKWLVVCQSMGYSRFRMFQVLLGPSLNPHTHGLLNLEKLERPSSHFWHVIAPISSSQSSKLDDRL